MVGMREAVVRVGRFYDLIQQHVNEQTYPPSERELARRLRVTPSTLANWRTPKRLIEKAHLEAVAELTGVPYIRVLDALLEDIGYIPKSRPDPEEPESKTA